MNRHRFIFGLTSAAFLLASFAPLGCGADAGDPDEADFEAADPELGTSKPYYLSDLTTFAYAASGYGALERDRSNGENGDADGRPISLRGRAFKKGLGVHADSDVRINLGGKCTRFYATVGIDDEVAPNGAVSFEVWADGIKLSQTGTLTGASSRQSLAVGVKGRQTLQLVVKGEGSTDFDHADWAGARVYCGDPPPAASEDVVTYTLSKDASGANPFKVDDDVVVKVDGAEVARGRDQQRLTFSARGGQTLEMALFDTIGGCFSSTEVWLTGGGLAPTLVVPEIANRCGAPANGTTPFYSVSFVIGVKPVLPPAPPVPPPPQECWAMYSHRSFSCDAPKWTCYYPTIRKDGQWASKAACMAARPDGLCSPNDCTWYTCAATACQ